nr:unnamed protein product [Callosobruchus analis]
MRTQNKDQAGISLIIMETKILQCYESSYTDLFISLLTMSGKGEDQEEREDSHHPALDIHCKLEIAVNHKDNFPVMYNNCYNFKKANFTLMYDLILRTDWSLLTTFDDIKANVDRSSKEFTSRAEDNIQSDPYKFWAFVSAKKSSANIPSTMFYGGKELTSPELILDAPTLGLDAHVGLLCKS